MDALLASPNWAFLVLFLGIISVVVMISVLRFNAFVALILTAIFVGLITPELPTDPPKDGQSAPLHIITAIELPMKEFGITAGKIAWVIALAAIIGTAMMASGAAERIVNWLLQLFKEKRAAIALLISGFILSIPVFFDTVFFLLIPLAIALAMKTGRNFVLYVVAIAGGAAITHSLVPPTPGPLIMAENMNIDVGLTILAGLGLGILPTIGVLFWARRLNQKLDIPVRVAVEESEKAKTYPSLILSLLPVVIPIVLISISSVVEVQMGKGNVPGLIAFLGNKNIAMAVGAAIALWLWAKQRDLSANELWKATAKPLEIAGMIILITSAGGAFGAMIKHSGISNAIELATKDFGISYIILGWFIASVMKTAQGSSTVAMIVSSEILYALIKDVDLSYHPMYILMAIGFGSLFISWMNDSGFWVVSKMSGFTEKEGIQTWTSTLAVISFIGLIQVLLLSLVLPFN